MPWRTGSIIVTIKAGRLQCATAPLDIVDYWSVASASFFFFFLPGK
jgi:hypothetical protein